MAMVSYWEYTTIKGFDFDDVFGRVECYGNDNWELVNIIFDMKSNQYIAVLKKQNERLRE